MSTGFWLAFDEDGNSIAEAGRALKFTGGPKPEP